MGLLEDLWYSLIHFFQNLFRFSVEADHSYPDCHPRLSKQGKTTPGDHNVLPRIHFDKTKIEQQRRSRIPVRPTKSKCEVEESCNEDSCCLCIQCNTHSCAFHFDSITCPLCCHKDTLQVFSSACWKKEKCEEKTPFDCYLQTCKHMYHEKCLREWYYDMMGVINGTICFYCVTEFNLDHIRTNFAEFVSKKPATQPLLSPSTPLTQRKSLSTGTRISNHKKPVKPTKRKCCECDKKPNYLCTHCGAHCCIEHKNLKACIACGTINSMQQFPDCCIEGCTEIDFDCYLTTCKHIHHYKCLDKLPQINADLTKHCIHCEIPFKQDNIKHDFDLLC